VRFDGKRNRDIFPDLLGRPLGEDELRRVIDEKESLYRALSAGRLITVSLGQVVRIAPGMFSAMAHDHE
jgi:hypothetical protein